MPKCLVFKVPKVTRISVTYCWTFWLKDDDAGEEEQEDGLAQLWTMLGHTRDGRISDRRAAHIEPPKLKVCAVVGQLRDASVSDRRVVNIESFQLRAVLGHHHEARIG